MNIKQSLMASLLFALMGCEQAVEPSLAPTDHPIRSEYNYVGDIRSFEQTFIGPPAIERVWSFKISRLVPEGSHVKKGQPVLWFDSTDPRQHFKRRTEKLDKQKQKQTDAELKYEQTYQQLKLQLAEAEMNRDKAELKAEINDPAMSLFDRKNHQLDAEISRERVAEIKDKIQLEKVSYLESQQSRARLINALQVVVDGMERGLAGLTVKTPQDGVVVYQRGTNGQPISSGSELYRGGTAISVVDMNFIEVVVAIPERDLQRIDLTAPITVTIETAEGQEWQGEIRSMAKVFRSEGSAVVADLVVKIVDPDKRLMKPGTKAQVHLGGRI